MVDITRDVLHLFGFVLRFRLSVTAKNVLNFG